METEDEIIILLDFVKDAQWLERKIDQRKREIKNESKIKQIARDVLQSLKIIHDQKFVHADLKIQNILIEKRDKQNFTPMKVKLADFGIAQSLQVEISGKHKAIMKEKSGTIGYIAPEI